MSTPETEEREHVYSLKQADKTEDANRRLWSRIGREKGLHRWTSLLLRRKWPALAALVLCFVAAAVWVSTRTTEASVEIELEVRSGGPGSSPAETSEVNRVVRQLNDERVLIEVARRMRLDRTADGDNVADRTAAAAKALVGQLQIRTGEPGRVHVVYEHRNAGHAAELLNLLADIFVAKRDTLTPVGGQSRDSNETSADVLQRARRELADFLRLNPISRIEPQKLQNQQRMEELLAEIADIDEALLTVGDGEAARSLRVRREDFVKMRERHATRLEELDRMDTRLATLERRVRDAEELVAQGPGVAAGTAAPQMMEPAALSQIAVARRARPGGITGISRAAVLAIAGLLGVIASVFVATVLDRRARPVENVADLRAAVDVPVLALVLDASGANKEGAQSVS